MVVLPPLVGRMAAINPGTGGTISIHQWRIAFQNWASLTSKTALRPTLLKSHLARTLHTHKANGTSVIPLIPSIRGEINLLGEVQVDRHNFLTLGGPRRVITIIKCNIPHPQRILRSNTIGMRLQVQLTRPIYNLPLRCILSAKHKFKTPIGRQALF